MLDGEAGVPEYRGSGRRIYWGPISARPDEIVISGRLAEVKERILEARAAAASGWRIMRYYLLRKGAISKSIGRCPALGGRS